MKIYSNNLNIFTWKLSINVFPKQVKFAHISAKTRVIVVKIKAPEVLKTGPR